MARHEVECIRKQDRYNPHERILGIGGINPDGTRWYCTQEQTIASIEAGLHGFFVRMKGKEVEVVVARSQYGHKDIKTEADDEQPNNLLSLLECPK